jgi:hypothetical protein
MRIKSCFNASGIADAHLVSFLAKIIFKPYSIWASTAKGRQTPLIFAQNLGIL